MRLRRVAAHKVDQHLDRQDAFAPALVLGDDLQQILPRQVVAGLQIDDPHLPAGADEPGNVVKGDIVARLGVVEAAACIALDQQRGRLVSLSHGSSGSAFAA